MGKLVTATTCIWLTAGWGAVFSAGLLLSAVSDGHGVFTAYAAIASAHFVIVTLSAGAVARSPHRRRWCGVAAFATLLVCLFGMISGFIFYGAPLLVLLALAVAPAPRTRALAV